MDYSFPRTPHIAFAGSELHTDIVLKVQDRLKLFRQKELTIQEKLDGNCVGIWYDDNARPRLIHRNGEIGEDDRFFKGLHAWYKNNEDQLFGVCSDRFVLYGEWLYWRHTINYDNLPSYFIAHDLYDRKNEKFVSTDSLKTALKETPIQTSNIIYRGKVKNLDDLIAKLHPTSQYGNDMMEGLYIRVDGKDYNISRAKFVNPEFHRRVEAAGHWRDNPLVRNISTNEIDIQLFGDARYQQHPKH